MPVKRETKAKVATPTKRAAATPAKRKRRTKRKKRATKKPTPAATASEETPPRTPIISKPVGDKVELSPNSLAKCQSCRRKILQQDPRVGKEVFFAPRKAYYHQYYHVACYERLPPASPQQHDVPSSLNLASGNSLQQELSAQRQHQANDRVLLQQRSALTKSLQDLRAAFAKRLQRPQWLVFDDAVLSHIVLRMPSDKRELLLVPGFKDKRYQCFGRPVLQVIQQYKQQQLQRGSIIIPIKKEQRASAASSGSSISNVIVIDDDSDGDDVMVGETLTCEEIVNRKFEHAAANNYLLTIDL